MQKVIDGLSEGLEAIADAIVGDTPHSQKVPIPTNSDRGKFLGVNASNNNIGWKKIEGVNLASAQTGQVLTAIEDMGGNLIQGWITPDEGLPTYDESDVGKVLMITENGPAWVDLN